MKSEEMIQSMYDSHPRLFQERFEVLDHLFCVIGNGMEWRDGEIVDKDDHTNPPVNPLINGKAYQRIIITDDYYRKKISNTPRKDKWYGIHQGYSLITKLPEDIKPDWMDLVTECTQMLFEDNIEGIDFISDLRSKIDGEKE